MTFDMNPADDEPMTKEEYEAWEALMADWPNCAVPDCEYKAGIPTGDKCYNHARGITPRPFDEYMNGQGD